MRRRGGSSGRTPHPPDPQTPQQWQEAIDAAAAWRTIADCKMYGLLEGGPEIDVARCDELLERGEHVGIKPSRSAVDLAVEMITAINADVGSKR